jgi:TetR/AcrR family transcriptional repressor of nem operon
MARGRPREFDEQETLERAMNAFWLRGYEGIGLAELLSEMGISRQSLYNTFGSKRDLFVRALDHYRTTHLTRGLALLDRPGSPIENVKSLMRFFEDMARDRRCRGCLVANTLVELGPHDEGIAALLRETLKLLQKSIQRTLTTAQRQGELAANKSPLELSRALMNAMIGLSVTGKLSMAEAEVRGIYAGTLSMLD